MDAPAAGGANGETGGEAAAAMTVPRATMRLQLHRGFTFADATRLVPYLASLGISHLYASPILTARAGSMHGYDVVDPTRVNPELGGEPGLRSLVAALRNAGLGIIVDIVPNHMAVGGMENPWWSDVLQHGQASRYATFFDIDWNSADPALRGKVLAPFLGEPYGEALRSGAITLARSDDAARRSSGISTTGFRSATRIMPRSRHPRRMSTIRRRRRAGRGSMLCWSASITGLPRGAPQVTRSTGAASSTSTAWPRCGSKTMRCSKRRTRRCSVCIRRV